MNITNKIRKIVINVAPTQISEIELSDDENFITKCGFNSISLVKLIVEIEKNFNIIVSDECLSFKNMSSIKEVENVILKEINNSH